MTPLPKPTVQQAIEALSDRDEFKSIVQFIREERERFFGDLRQCVETNEVMKVAGSISTLDELLTLLSNNVTQ
jgi:histidinol-phosphate/aromatic aminotransferase/cobyric acid decarboxylase-like protein